MSERVALRLAYDGAPFRGSQRQPGLRTVEGELLRALERVGAGSDPRELGLQVASRTDRGVSAAGNVVVLDTDLRPEALSAGLNAHLRDAWVTGWTRVTEDFRPRWASSRTYRYHLVPEPRVDVEAAVRVLEAFRGSHDLSAFARVEPHQDAHRRVDEVAVTRRGDLLEADVTARSFLWHQVRRMVGAALLVARGEVPEAEVRAALAGEPPRRGFPPAPPEPLVLLRITYADITFAPVPAPRLGSAHGRARVRERVLASLLATGAEDPSTAREVGDP